MKATTRMLEQQLAAARADLAAARVAVRKAEERAAIAEASAREAWRCVRDLAPTRSFGLAVGGV